MVQHFQDDITQEADTTNHKRAGGRMPLNDLELVSGQPSRLSQYSPGNRHLPNIVQECAVIPSLHLLCARSELPVQFDGDRGDALGVSTRVWIFKFDRSNKRTEGSLLRIF